MSLASMGDVGDASNGFDVVDWFADLYRDHAKGLTRLAFVMIADLEAAEDVVHTAFAKVYVKRSAVRDPLSYVRSAVYNGCRNHQRALRIRRNQPIAAESSAPVGDHVIDVIRQLPIRRRAMVVLRFYHHMNDAEIAAVLGVPVGTVKSTLHRTLIDLREELRDEP